MDDKKIQDVLTWLNDQDPAIALSVVISSDGLPICYKGDGEHMEMASASYIELKLVCDSTLGDLGYGISEEIFVRTTGAVLTIWPLGDSNLFACMAHPNVNTKMFRMHAWRAVTRMFHLFH